MEVGAEREVEGEESRTEALMEILGSPGGAAKSPETPNSSWIILLFLFLFFGISQQSKNKTKVKQRDGIVSLF